MRPISPNTGADELVIAEEQEEYAALPAAFYRTTEEAYGLPLLVLTRWTLSPEERARVAAGEDIYVWQIGTPIRPMGVQVGPDAPEGSTVGGRFTLPTPAGG